MKTQTHSVIFRRIVPVVFLLLILLAACSQPSVQVETPVATSIVLPSEAAPTETMAPTETSHPGKVLLVTTDQNGPLAQVVNDLAGQAGWMVDSRPALETSDLDQNAKMVVFAAPPANLNDLLAAAPQAQFVVVSPSDLAIAPNLSVIRLRPENQAFVAGNIAVLYAADWRAGGLLPSDGPLGAGLADAFVNGGHYFCGMCAPGWPLGVYYPLTGALPAASDGPVWQGAAAELFDTQKVNLFFLAAEAVKPEVISYLQGKDQFGVTVRVIGVQAPPAELKDQWLVTVALDAPAALRTLWPGVAAGQGGQVLDAPVVLEDLNGETAGEGRLRLVDEMMQELAAGRIYPFTVPAQ